MLEKAEHSLPSPRKQQPQPQLNTELKGKWPRAQGLSSAEGACRTCVDERFGRECWGEALGLGCGEAACGVSDTCVTLCFSLGRTAEKGGVAGCSRACEGLVGGGSKAEVGGGT